MSFLNIFKKKQPQTNSSESSYASNFSDEVSGDYAIKKSRDAVVQDAKSLWDCRDRMLLSLRKIKTVGEEVSEDEAKIQPEDRPIIVEEFQPDTTLVDLQGSVSSQTINQPTRTSTVTYDSTTDQSQHISKCLPDTTTGNLQGSVSSQTIDQSTDTAAFTYKPTVDNSQQSTESSIKHVEKKTKLPPVIEPQIIEWDESCMSMKEYSAYNSMVDKLCQLQTTTEYPKHVKKRVFAPVLETRQLLERCLQQTDHQATAQRPEIQFRLSVAAAEAKYLAGNMTFLAIDVNHTTGTPDQIKMLIDVYDACFRRFKKIMKIVRQIEMPERKDE